VPAVVRAFVADRRNECAQNPAQKNPARRAGVLIVLSCWNPPILSRTYLNVSFAQKDEAKALGARWDPQRRKWYVPAGLNLAPFERWLDPAVAAGDQNPGRSLLPAEGASAELAVPDAGARAALSLSHLLQQVSAVVDNAFAQPVWVMVEVVNARTHSNGHVYLELSERDPEGRVLAKASAMIWASNAMRVLPRFEQRTGAQIAPGIKLLVQARPVFKAQYGFSLEIYDIDPDYTLGDLEAQKREIRARLQRENLFERNRQLPPPWDYQTVLVLAPRGAAGLGDFQREAQRLERFGVCRFVYVYSRFQGEGAAAEIGAALRHALETWPASEPLDAIAIIRGGGAVNDLAWLNDYALARLICEAPVPVLTGIGHERDNTILDEVANQRFDTPSKVIGGIERTIKARVDEVRRAYDLIRQAASRAVAAARRETGALETTVREQSQRQLARGRHVMSEALGGVRLAAVKAVHEARRKTQHLVVEVRHQAHRHVGAARAAVPAMFMDIRSESRQALQTARFMTHAQLGGVVDRVRVQTRRARENVQQRQADLAERSRRIVVEARTRSESYWREIIGQGPQKTLARGFALVRDEQQAPVTSAARARATLQMHVQFHDGTVAVARAEAASPSSGPQERASAGARASSRSQNVRRSARKRAVQEPSTQALPLPLENNPEQS